MPICGSTSPLSGAPGNVSANASVIACLRICGSAIGVLDGDFQHDLVVQPRDRTAVDPGFEQPLVDIGERQHRGVGASALHRQVCGGRVERPALPEAGLGKETSDSARRVAADDDASAIDAPLVVVVTPAHETGVGGFERPQLRARFVDRELDAIAGPGAQRELVGPIP